MTRVLSLESFPLANADAVVARARSGDPEALEQIFRAFQTPVYNLARRICRTVEDAEDVLQEAIIRLWRTAGCLPDSPPPSLPLAYTSIRHTAIDLARRNIRRTKREQKSDYVVDEFSEAKDWFGTASLEEKERNAAIANAIYQATGVRMQQLPMSPPRIMEQIWNKNGS